MGLIYLADTNIISELMRPHPHPGVQMYWQQNHSQTAIAAVTWHELLTGTQRLPASKRRTAFERFLHGGPLLSIPIFPYDKAAAAWHAQQRAYLMHIGRPTSFPDGQIAAVAFTNNLTLVTRNTKDFADFTELRLDNWFQET